MTPEKSKPSRETFLRPRLVGARFEEGGIPLEVLKDLAVIEEMMFEVAKQLFLKQNEDRQRSPRHFLKDVALKLTGVEIGSAAPVIALEQLSDDLPNVDSLSMSYLDKAREAFLSLLCRAEGDLLESGDFPEKCLGFFDRFGRSLRDNESMVFEAPKDLTPPKPPTLTHATRRKLLWLSSSTKEITEEALFRGAVPEADQEKWTFTFVPIGGQRVTAPIPVQHLDTVLSAFNGFNNGQRVLLRGIARFSRAERLLGFESVDHLALLDPLDVPAQLDEFRTMEDGWLEGGGIAPRAKDLDWFEVVFERNFPDDLPLPYVYPTPEGGVQAEWPVEGGEASLDVDLGQRTATFYGPALDEKSCQEMEIDLNTAAGWNILADKLRTWRGTAA